MPGAPAPTRWPILLALTWLAAAGGLAQVFVAWLWHDPLNEVGPAWLALHYAAFMAAVFAYHAGLAMLPVMAFAVWKRRWRLLRVAAAVFALGAGPELVSVFPRGTAPDGRPSLRVMSVNLMYGLTDAPSLLEQIARERPDVLLFQEWTPEAATALRASLSADFPASTEVLREDAFGQAVFGRRPFLDPPRVFPPADASGEPQITVAVDLAGKPLRITNLHVLPPVSLSYFREQRRTARAIASWAHGDANEPPHVIMGDFNSTCRTSILRPFLQHGWREAHAAAGWWRGSTWPRIGRLALAPGLRLDHLLVTPGVVPLQARTGDDTGSDHRPVIVDLAWE
jgi:endonuclease/exonuclease/phosphatase (EEP) superfamily protein YafD